jgi:hypothetical protein
MPITTILAFFSTISIVTGAIFAGVQFRQLNRTRARESALQLVQSARTPEFIAAISVMWNLPDGLSAKEIEERLGDKMSSAYILFWTFESLGILVFRKEIEIELVEDFYSGVIIFSGRKFGRYLSEIREISGRETYFEWFQWLYEVVERRESKTPPVPAYIANRNWGK